MLTGEQVFQLMEAGFTPDEIRSYNNPSAAEPEPDTPSPELASPEGESEQEETQNTVTRTEFEEMKTAMQELTKAIKANNILTASKETPAEKLLTPAEAADAAIKAFFNS